MFAVYYLLATRAKQTVRPTTVGALVPGGYKKLGWCQTSNISTLQTFTVWVSGMAYPWNEKKQWP